MGLNKRAAKSAGKDIAVLAITIVIAFGIAGIALGIGALVAWLTTYWIGFAVGVVVWFLEMYLLNYYIEAETGDKFNPHLYTYNIVVNSNREGAAEEIKREVDLRTRPKAVNVVSPEPTAPITPSEDTSK